MELKEAIAILERHNEWRRSNEISSRMVMENPKEVGIAIDTAVRELKKLTTKEAMLKNRLSHLKGY